MAEKCVTEWITLLFMCENEWKIHVRRKEKRFICETEKFGSKQFSRRKKKTFSIVYKSPEFYLLHFF